MCIIVLIISKERVSEISLNAFTGFQQKRMEIFSELVKRYWNGELKDIKDLDKLALDIKEKYEFKEDDLSFIKDQIRVAMGLEPKGKAKFENELEEITEIDAIKKPIVSKIEGVCEYCDKEDCGCDDICRYEAQVYKRQKGPVIVNDKCLSCGQCINDCDFGALADKIEFIPLINMLKDTNTKVYATVAPAIIGQFGDNISMGQIRTGLKLLGFQDMIEVAMFADILTIKEAHEFNHLVKKEEDFFLTSCCCPVWFNLTKKNYPDTFEHMSPSISPMIASGRFLKELYPESKVVFIGPCIAKKGEAKEPSLKGDIDFVLTFRELDQIFKSLDIDLKSLEGDEKDQASFGGRVYARTGGVSFSVKTVVNRIAPRRLIKLQAKKVDGVKNCKLILDHLSSGKELSANFVEGMGCDGGCVGGPRTNIEVDKATRIVNEFGEDSLIMTPYDNLNVMKILNELGFDSMEDIVKEEYLIKLLTRE
ncbi:iron hydrogenase [Clostridium sp. D2Q-11]|uniref:Iron hydrogenase n=1 Tax=Anaeromonas frigoriresistens TaxID=2683708 RepID=A0A942UTU3_9FIRM|nr:[Fe-Fe] hydrogenase large subunit C-terminal domain-containing protein [Anaeromonas frigoriresistens]MBS4539129.1 iron hydrogenase [Anaeromonas frigoriresistens]